MTFVLLPLLIIAFALTRPRASEVFLHKQGIYAIMLEVFFPSGKALLTHCVNNSAQLTRRHARAQDEVNHPSCFPRIALAFPALAPALDKRATIT